MSIQEQDQVREEFYTEALRYMQNAEDTLSKAGKDGKYYIDDKYVKTACGTAYNGVLKALDGILILKGVKKAKNRKSIEYYRDSVSLIDKKFMNEVNTVYGVLHLEGYYDGVKNVKVIMGGFEVAYDIIERIKPVHS